jgi:glycosyltransferase involved in cell wall biosynthesis
VHKRPASPPGGRTLAAFHLAESSGPSRSLVAELRWLAGEPGELEVLVPGPGRVADEYAEFATVTALPYRSLTVPAGVRDVGSVGLALARDVRTFRAQVRSAQPDRVVAVTTMLPALLVAARLEKVPVLVYAAEIVPAAPGPARRAGSAALLRLTSGVAGSIACCSDTVAMQFRRPGHPPLVTVYPPIAAPPAGDGAGFRRRHGLAADAPCVATVGSISRGRGQDVLVRALPALRERFPALRAVVVGDPHPRGPDREYHQELRDLARGLGVLDALVFTGHVELLGDVYAAADVVVNPTRREAFGRVAAEALLAGRPVVATGVEAVPEVLRDGVDALLVAPGSPVELAAATARVLEDEQLAARLVANGAERVGREFTPERSLDHFAEAVGALPRR